MSSVVQMGPERVEPRHEATDVGRRPQALSGGPEGPRAALGRHETSEEDQDAEGESAEEDGTSDDSSTGQAPPHDPPPPPPPGGKKKKLHRTSRSRLEEEPFQISVIGVTSNSDFSGRSGLQTLQLDLPRVSSFGSFVPPQSSSGGGSCGVHGAAAFLQPFYLPETSRSASLTVLPGESAGVGVGGGGAPLPPYRSSSSGSLLASALLRGAPQEGQPPPRPRSLSATTRFSRRKSRSPLRGGLPSPGRRFSDLQSLTSSLGLHIHESLLSLASSYGKSWKQVIAAADSDRFFPGVQVSFLSTFSRKLRAVVAQSYRIFALGSIGRTFP